MTATAPKPDPTMSPPFHEPAAEITSPLVALFSRFTGNRPAYPLTILFFLHFVDEFDTAAFGVLSPEIQEAFDLSDAGFGFLVIINVSIVLLLAVPLGVYGDRLPRTKIVVAGAVVSAIFSFLTGVVTVLALLVLVRIINGVGVLVNDPIHRSLLADYYDPKDRASIFAVHQNAQRFAAMVGPVVAGVVAYLFSWRVAFMILLVPVMGMALLATRLKEPVRGITDDEEAALLSEGARPIPAGRGSRMLFQVKTLRRQYLAWVFIGAGFIPLAFMIPQYYDREFDLSTVARGVLGAVAALAAFGGTIWGASQTPKWFGKGMGEPLKWAGISLVTVGPALVLLALAPSIWVAVPIAITSSFLGGIFGPAFLSTQALVSPARVRSLSYSFGSVFLVAGLWLLYLNPVVGIPLISDNHGIRWGLASLAPFWLIGGYAVYSAARFVERDVEQAMEVLQTTAELKRAQRNDDSTILAVRNVDVSYGSVQVLFDVSFDLAQGEILALLGTNGAGKSTILRAISGLVAPDRGAIYFDGEEVSGLEPEDSFQLGLVQVPGGKGVFPGLTVKENLDVAAWASRRPKAEVDAAIADVLETFPSLERRIEQKAVNLSGGEQQMLTLGQAFIAKPKLLMIDELSLGLAPIIVEDLLRIVRRIHSEGTSVILVEQSVNVALTVAQRAIFMEKGEVRFSGPTAELLERADILRAVFLAGAGSIEEGQ